jgi:serine/threonine protein kinase
MQVTNLADFLWVCEQSHCQGMSAAIFVNAALDVASGLEYLHSRDVTHRDLKPANVLVSNHHYQALKDVKKIETMVSIKPLVCKLADFGESRSRDICTQQIIMSKTKRVDRGRLIFAIYI